MTDKEWLSFTYQVATNGVGFPFIPPSCALNGFWLEISIIPPIPPGPAPASGGGPPKWKRRKKLDECIKATIKFTTEEGKQIYNIEECDIKIIVNMLENNLSIKAKLLEEGKVTIKIEA